MDNEFWHLYLANGLGVLAFCQCPLIIVLIQKNNPISFLTGITYQKFNYLHRASSRVALLFSWIHFLLWTPRVYYAGHFSHWYVIWGLIAIFGFTGLWITSFRFVRRVAFEFFLIAHIILTVVFIGGAFLHWYRLGFWMWPCFVLWGLDRVVRGLRMLQINPPAAFRWCKADASGAGQCEIKLLSSDVLLITATRPGLKWSAGQHFFLSSPSISYSPTETHPFSVANMPNERDEVVFVVKVHSGFTKRLRDRLHSDVTTDIPIYLEGPYGSHHDLSSYSTVILVAGGTGVTYLSSNLLGLLRSSTPNLPRHIHLVWHIRHASDARWLGNLLNEAADLAQFHSQTYLTIDIHVTKSHRADEPTPRPGFTDQLIDDYAPRSFSRRYSRLATKREISGLGDMSEVPSAVVSDDEDETPLNTRSRQLENGQIVSTTEETSPASSSSDTTQVSVYMVDRLDEIDRLAEEHGGEHADDCAHLLPKRPVVLKHNFSDSDSFGLTPAASGLISWKKGRADLREVLESDLEITKGAVNMTVCGPVQLLHAARRAVRDVATPARALRGDWPVDFYEETLGS